MIKNIIMILAITLILSACSQWTNTDNAHNNKEHQQSQKEEKSDRHTTDLDFKPVSTEIVKKGQRNQDYFEKANVTDATDSTYAALYNQDGKWVIESGVWENDEIKAQKLYKYEAGKLIEKISKDGL